MLADEAAQDAIAQNLANAATTGYKRDVPQFQSFGEALLSRTAGGGAGPGVGGLGGGAGPGVGGLGGGAGLRATVTDFSGGGLQLTGNPLDVALTGAAFLAVRTPQGVRYSRDGALTRDAQGTLIQAGTGGAVLDQSGAPITLPANAKSITIGPRGEIQADGVTVGTLQLVGVTAATGAVKQGGNLFAQAAAGPAGPGAAVHQGFLEASNVNAVQEMVAMIAVQRSYETDQKMVQAEDAATGKAFNDVAKI